MRREGSDGESGEAAWVRAQPEWRAINDSIDRVNISAGDGWLMEDFEVLLKADVGASAGSRVGSLKM